MKQTVGNILKQKRKQAGMTQKQLAESMSVSLKQVGRWELDENVPEVDNLRTLSTIFGFDFFSLLSDQANIANTLTGSDEKQIFILASLRAMFNEIAKLKANAYGGDVQNWLEELRQNTSLIESDLMQDLNK